MKSGMLMAAASVLALLLGFLLSSSKMKGLGASGLREPASAAVPRFEPALSIARLATSELSANSVVISAARRDAWTEAQALLSRSLAHPRVPDVKSAFKREQEFDAKFTELGFTTMTLDLAGLPVAREHCRAGESSACDWTAALLHAKGLELESEIASSIDEKKSSRFSAERLAVESEALPLAIVACIDGGKSCPFALEWLRDQPRERQRLLALLIMYCDGGFERGCYAAENELVARLGLPPSEDSLEESGDPVADERAQAAKLSSANCDRGALRSCLNVMRSGAVAEDDARSEAAFTALHAACDSGSADKVAACEMLATLFFDKGDAEFAGAFAEQACDKGSAGGCLQLAKLERDRAGDLAATTLPLKRYCKLQNASDDRQIGDMCRALDTGHVSSSEFWKSYGGARVVSGGGTVISLEELISSRFLY